VKEIEIMKQYIVIADGSLSRRPDGLRTAAFSSSVLLWDGQSVEVVADWLFGYSPHVGQNRMELQGIMEGIAVVIEHSTRNLIVPSVIIASDSQYCESLIDDRQAEKIHANSMCVSSGRSAVNRDLIAGWLQQRPQLNGVSFYKLSSKRSKTLGWSLDEGLIREVYHRHKIIGIRTRRIACGFADDLLRKVDYVVPIPQEVHA
jgi:ribonuclease HI